MIQRQLVVMTGDQHVAHMAFLAEGLAEFGAVEETGDLRAEQVISGLGQYRATLLVDFLYPPLAIDQNRAVPRAVQNGFEFFLGHEIAIEILVDQHRALEGNQRWFPCWIR